jgi:hypothetical protein
MGKKNTCTILFGKLEGKRSLGRARRGWEDTDVRKIGYVREIGCEGVDWIYLAQYSVQLQAIVNRAVNIRVPQNSGNFLTE